MTLLPIGFGLYGLWGLGDLYEVQSGSFFRVRPMVGISVWTGITAHGTCVPSFRSSASSPGIGKT
jgi:hypothetical protein